ncbi:MAG TPA: CoA transferase, partial [Ramlibacter sp.]|nr:CoA transferase [Ramlibacter sp.]
MKLPLTGVKVVEFEGLGPGPLAGRMLADMGAEVTVIAPPRQGAVAKLLGGELVSPLRRGKTIVPLDLKQPEDNARAMALVEAADVLIEGNRPGVMERLGLGPAQCAARNPRLVYGRMTGWGQS